MDRTLIERLLEDLSRLRDSLAVAPSDDTGVELDRTDWLTNILAHSPDVISILDLDGRLLYLSQAVSGRAAQAYVGQPSSDFLVPSHRGPWRQALERAIATGTAQRIESFSHHGLWWDTRIVPIQREGRVSWLLTIGTDITTHKQAQAALAMRDQQLRLALEASGMGQWSWEIKADRFTWDEAARAIFAWPDNGGDVDLARFLDRVHPGDRDRVRAGVWAAVQSGEYPDVSCRIVLPGGPVRWILAKGRALRDPDGATSRLIGGVMDITHGKRTEAQLQRSQKLEAIGQLAGGVAHDFNNLLVAILGNLALAQKNQRADDTDEGRERADLLADAMDAANRAAELTRQLLAFSTRQPLDQAPLDLNTVLADTLKLLRRLLPESVEMDLIPGQRLPRVMADRGQVEQVFLNLCLNARDAMLNGGKLAIETEVVVVNGRFRETHPWASPGRYLLISVTDNGVGIPVEALDHVFEPFFTTKPHGTGLGLATVYGIVQRHGGFIHVYSEVGKGTTFKVYLPVAERGAADTGTKVQDPVVGGQETILVAEDEPQVRAVVTRILQRAGYRVLTAEDGDQAVRRFREHQDQIGLVLTDAVMPNKNGADALAEIRAIAPGLPAVLCSGYSDALDRFNNPASGVAFLPKPYEPDVLLRVVRRQLDTRRGS
jgi:PAS domain S-box-containing protein